MLKNSLRADKSNNLFSWDDFGGLDQSKQFDFFVGSLEAMDSQPSNQMIQAKMLKNMNLKSGDKILEVGCGIGKLAQRIAQSADCQVTAIDKSNKVIEIARTTVNSPNVVYQQADAIALPFLDESFDIVTCERFLINFTDSSLIIKEMCRVLKPGGMLIVTDFDPASILITPADTIMHKIFMDIYMPSFADPFVGRKIPQLFQQTGIQNFTVDADISYERNMAYLNKIIPMQLVLDGGVNAGYLTRYKADQWLESLYHASDCGTFLYAITVISVCGYKAHRQSLLYEH